MTKNWLSFKIQKDGGYSFDEEGVFISISKDGLLKLKKQGELVFEKQFHSASKAILEIADLYKKFK